MSSRGRPLPRKWDPCIGHLNWSKTDTQENRIYQYKKYIDPIYRYITYTDPIYRYTYIYTHILRITIFKNSRLGRGLRPNSFPNWYNIEVWLGLGRLSGDSWAALGSKTLLSNLLTASWVALEGSWAPLGRLVRRIGHKCWASLCVPWKHLGGVHAPLRRLKLDNPLVFC